MWALIAAAALAFPAGAKDGRGWEWRRTQTPHFTVNHQDSRLPAGFTMGAEKVHSRLRMDLGLFSPWMNRERVDLYVYRNQESFLEGEFRPPQWANGLVIYDRRAVAMPAARDPRKMLQVLAHETTHLLFDSFWRERRRVPPPWINEGLAMLEETGPERPEASVWYRQMAVRDPKSFPPLAAFFKITPTKDLHEKDSAGEWYVQAYSVVHFLLRRHSRLQFKSLCAALRDGKPVEEALWLTYRYKKVSDLDQKWRAWLAEPGHRRRVAALSGADLKGIDNEPVRRSGSRNFRH